MRMYLQIRTNVKDVSLEDLKLRLTDGRTVHLTWQHSRSTPEQGTHVCIMCEDVVLNCGEGTAKIPELKGSKLCGVSVTVSDELPVGFPINLELGLIEIWEGKDGILIQYGDSDQGGENEDG